MDWEKALEIELEKINFDGIHQYMRAVNWFWGGIGVPSVSQLRLQFVSLFWDAVASFQKNGVRGSCGSGGIWVFINKYEHTIDPMIHVVFDIAREKRCISHGIAGFLNT